MMEGGGKTWMGILFSAVSLATAVILPALLLLSILHPSLTNSLYYTAVLKGSNLLKAFVGGRYAEADRLAREEIERDVRPAESAAAEREKKFESAREVYERVNRTGEYVDLEKKLAEMKASSWKDAPGRFPDNKSFEKNRDAGTAKLGGRMRDIETYREKNSGVIGRAEKEFELARESLEEVREELAEKHREAGRIIERHRGAFAGRLAGDLARLDARLTPLLNRTLIDGPVKREIEKQLDFLRSYEKQADPGAVDNEGKGDPVVRVPPVVISLWVDLPGVGRRHLLSQIFVEEIRKEPALENRDLLVAMFRESDTVLGEYLANRYLKKAGLSVNDGVIRFRPPVLEGKAARAVNLAIMGASYGRYLKYLTGFLFALYLVFLLLFPVSRGVKRAWLGRIFLYPSIAVLLGAITLAAASELIFDIYPYLVPDAMLMGFAKNIARAAALYLAIPVIIIFLPLFLAGLALGRSSILGRMTKDKD